MKRTVDEMAGSRNSMGFTAIEVIAVLLIMGIIAAVVLSSATSTGIYSLKSQADIVKDHLRYAQTRSMNSSVIFGVNFSGNSYFLYTNGNTTDKLMLPGADADTVNLSSGIAAAVSGGGTISFDGWGRPYTDAAATAPQSGNRTINLSLGGDTEVVTITENTGFIP